MRRFMFICLALTACTSTVTTTTVAPSGSIQSGSEASPEQLTTTSVLIGIEASNGIGDDFYPGLGNSGYDVQHVTLDLDFDPFGPRISGVATFEVVATDDLASWSVDLSTVFASEVLVDGEPVAFEQTSGELRVTANEPIPNGAEFRMEVTYGGQPVPFTSAGAPFFTGFHESEDGWYALSEPDGASSWFPSNDHPLDKSTYTVSVTVPNPMVAVSSGRLEGVESDRDFSTYLWEVEQPIASYLLAFAVGDFERVDEETVDGIEVRNYFDSDLTTSERQVFAQQGAMIRYFSTVFGDYPFDAYGALVLETTDVGTALETQTMSTFGRQVLFLGDSVVAHELAHQWFGDSVSITEWRDIWINEGFATYAQWLWSEHDSGTTRRDLEIVQAYEVISGAIFVRNDTNAAAAATIAAEQFPPPGDVKSDDLFNTSVYLRGGLTLHALRLEIGDDAFFELLRTYTDELAYGNSSTETFVEYAEEAAGKDLTNFFQGWLYDEQMPAIPELGLEPLSN